MQDEGLILAIDQGTTSSRAIVFSREGNPLIKSSREFKQHYPQPGWVEHDPEDIIGSVITVMQEAVGLYGSDCFSAMGITNQRETTIVWEKDSGKAICPAIVWQCRRTADYCNRLKDGGLENLIYEKTGLMPDAYFSATKLKWILDNVPSARERAEKGELCFGTVDAFLMFRLSGGKIFATDYTNAARTMLFNIHTLRWDDDLLTLFNIPAAMLPSVYPSAHRFGKTDKSVCGISVDICGVAGDQQAALFGQRCFSPGSVKNTYGTGCFLLMNTGDKAVQSKRGLITTLAAGAGEKPHYALEGSVFVGGAAVQWLRDEMRLISSSAESERIAMSVPDSGGVYVVPAFVGLGAPHWDSFARGTICGITRGTKREHIVRATLEGIAFQVFDVLHAMERDTGLATPCLRVDGGASANNFLMQFQADISGVKTVRPSVVETTALGAAFLAGLTVGVYADEAEIASYDVKRHIFKPRMSKEQRTSLIEGWETAVGRTKYR